MCSQQVSLEFLSLKPYKNKFKEIVPFLLSTSLIIYNFNV